MTYTIAFILEQALGHITHSRNLMHHVAGDSSVKALWGLPAYETTGLARYVPLYRSNWTVRAGLQSRRLLSQMKRQSAPDVIFFHTQVTATLAQDWLASIPSVVSLDATPLQYDTLGAVYGHQRGSNALEQWKWRINRDCFRKAQRIVAWSTWAKDGLSAEYQVPAEKVSVIPPGVTVSEWTPPAERKPHTGVRILFVGGDLERKGGLTLIEVFRQLRQELSAEVGFAGMPIELHLVTRNPIPEEPGIYTYNHMQPNTAALKNLFFESDIFCLPTLGDCLPVALAEAGAAHLPLVSTRVGAIPEIVRDGETGFIVPPGDAAALSNGLRHLVCDAALRRRLGEQAARMVCADHDAGVNASRLLDLLKYTANENRASKRIL